MEGVKEVNVTTQMLIIQGGRCVNDLLVTPVLYTRCGMCVLLCGCFQWSSGTRASKVNDRIFCTFANEICASSLTEAKK